MENSLHYLGESLNHVMQFQQNVNRNMVEHLNMTAKNQLLQGQALGRLVENTQQREFDKLFDSIPVYDGEDPEKFEPWLSKLESACREERCERGSHMLQHRTSIGGTE